MRLMLLTPMMAAAAALAAGPALAAKPSKATKAPQPAPAAAKTPQPAAAKAPTEYHIAAKLVRIQVDPDGKASETVEMTPEIITLNHLPAQMQTSDNGQTVRALLIPSVNRDGTLSMDARIQALDAKGTPVTSGRSKSKIKLGQWSHVVGMTAANDPAVQRAMQQGQVITNRGAYSGYYISVKPAAAAPDAHPAP